MKRIIFILFVIFIFFFILKPTIYSSVTKYKKYNSFFDSAKYIVIYYHYTSNYPKIFKKKNIFEGTEDTFERMWKSVNKQFLKYKKQLIKEWKLKGKLLEAAFIINVVNNMFALGDGTGKPSSVSCNKDIKNGHLNKETGYYAIQCITPKNYLQSKYGDCNDYAMLTYIFFNLAGIPNKQVGWGGHIYNEAYINGKPYIFDALNLFFTQMDNETFLHQPYGKKVIYHLFYLSGANPVEDIFRAKRGSYRMYFILTTGRTHYYQSKDFSHWNHFKRFIRTNRVCQP